VGARNKPGVHNKPVAHSKPAVRNKPGEEAPALVAAEEVVDIRAEAVRIRAVVVGIRVEAVRIRAEAEASLEMPMVLPWHQQASPFH
jgi:hypothetical protein